MDVYDDDDDVDVDVDVDVDDARGSFRDGDDDGGKWYRFSSSLWTSQVAEERQVVRSTRED